MELEGRGTGEGKCPQVPAQSWMEPCATTRGFARQLGSGNRYIARRGNAFVKVFLVQSMSRLDECW